MIHTNKMILVPHEVVGGNEHTAKFMSDLDREMLRIIQDNSVPIDAKVLQYNQILRRYQIMKQDVEKPHQLEIRDVAAAPGVESKVEVDPFQQAVIETVPHKWHKNALLLLKYARKNSHIKWSDKGEMIVDGNKIVGSNIVDLINDFSRTGKSKPAIGANIFLQKLINENIPKSTIINKNRLSLLDEKDVYVSPDMCTPSSTEKRTTPIDNNKSLTPPLVKKRPRTRSLLQSWAKLNL